MMKCALGLAWMINTSVSGAIGVALAVTIGFGWGGWTTREAASREAADAAEAALAASWTPHCLAQSQAASAQKAVAELKVAFRRNRPGLIQNAGWATPIGQTDASWAVASACALALAAQWGED